MAAFVALSVILGLCPLVLLAPKMARIRRAGLLEYAKLGTEYTEAFDRKWVHTERPPAEPLLGTSDIQSLADLGNSYTIIEEMPLIPVIVVYTPTSEIVNAILK